MRISTLAATFTSLVLLAMSMAHAASAAPETTGTCALLQPEDLVSALGAQATATLKGVSCKWTSSDNSKKVVITHSPQNKMSANMSFSQAKRKFSSAPTFSDEKGIGDKAFSILRPKAVVMITFVHGNLFQFLYKTGKATTSEDLKALRPIARKINAKF